MYDPLSISNSLLSYINNRQYTGDEFFYLNELWHSWQHHSLFSGIDKNEVLQNINAHSAAIDVSDTEHVVAVPENICKERVRKFGTMTCDLQLIVLWLKECLIKTVAMESTGVYWRPLFSVLVRAGFEVHQVNSKHVKNVTGRKTDEDDAMWIQKLQSCDLLKSSYLPDDQQDAIRTLVRYRRTLVQDSSRFVNRMQKAMELMNIKFHTLLVNYRPNGQSRCRGNF